MQNKLKVYKGAGKYKKIAFLFAIMEAMFTPQVVTATHADESDAKRQYILSNHWEHARQRLAWLEEASNPYTFRFLESVNIQKGWHCLDAGAGLGGVTRWLAQRVGPTGVVTALDMDPHFLREIPAANVRVLEQNLVTDDLSPETYDCIFARDVLMHIPERESVIKKFVQALKPGGLLITEDLGRLPEGTAYQGFSTDKEVSSMANRILLDLERDGHVSFVAAYASPRYFRASGLINVTGHAETTVNTGNDVAAQMAGLSRQQYKPLLMEKGYDEEIYDRHVKTFFDESALWWGLLHVTSIGYKPL